MNSSQITRRGFLQGASLLAVSALGAGAPSSAAPGWAHRIVRAHNPLASFFDVLDFEFKADVRDTYYGGFVNQQIVQGMFDTALCRLTGENDPATAMRRLVPYQPDERVFLKINNTGTVDLWKGSWETFPWDIHYNDMDAIAEPINATIRALVRIGVPQEKIGIGDASWTEGRPDASLRIPRCTADRLAKRIKAAFPSVVLYRSSLLPEKDGITWTSNDRHAIVEFRDPLIERRPQRVTSHRVPDQLIGAAHMINIPIMKRHDQAGVTGALKNNFGTIASVSYFHEPFYGGPGRQSAMMHNDANPAIDIWLNPHVGPKTRLIVCDGIFAGWNWGSNPPVGWKQFGGRSPNCLLLGTDPVAMDSVVCDHVTESLADKVQSYAPPAMLIDGSRVGLGRYESRKAPRAGYRTIEYQEINQEGDADKLAKLAALKKRYLAGGKTAGEIRAVLQEARAIVAS